MGTPLTSMLTSSLMLGRLLSSLPAIAFDDAVAVLDHVFEFMPEMFHEALHRPGGGVAEGANGVAFDLVGHVHQHVQVLLAAFAGEHSLQQTIHPAGAFTARRALSAGFGVVEARNALEDSHHAS